MPLFTHVRKTTQLRGTLELKHQLRVRKNERTEADCVCTDA